MGSPLFLALEETSTARTMGLKLLAFVAVLNLVVSDPAPEPAPEPQPDVIVDVRQV